MWDKVLRTLVLCSAATLSSGLQSGLQLARANESGLAVERLEAQLADLAQASQSKARAETVVASETAHDPRWHLKPREAAAPEQVIIPPWWRRTAHFVGGANNTGEFVILFLVIVAFVADHWILHLHQVSSSLAATAWLFLGLAAVATELAVDSKYLAENFLAGWLFQLLGGLEDLFIFHVIMEAFGADFYERYVAMIWVSVTQMIFQFLLMVELEFFILSIGWLPYLLGTWLALAGLSALVSSDEHSCMGLAEGLVVKVLRLLCGRHFSETFEEGACITGRSGYVTISMLLPMVMYCIATDLLFELDTTLTKIEAYGNRGGFTDYVSSLVAAAAIPHFYFVALQLFVRFPLMKYAIALLLLVFGVGLLLKEVISVSPEAEAGVLVGVVGIVIVYSLCSGNVNSMPEAGKEQDSEKAPQEAVAKNTKLGSS